MTDYTFDEYQDKTHATAVYPSSTQMEALAYLGLGLTGEAGEIAEKIKKAMRDDGGVLTDARRESLRGEIGDLAWYMSELCSTLGFSLADIAKGNIQKLADRQQRGVLSGSGDNR